MAKFVSIQPDATLSDVANIVGRTNLDQVLGYNDLPRVRNIGKALRDQQSATIAATATPSWNRKLAVLNTLSEDSDVYETAALAGESDWKLLSAVGGLRNMIRMPNSLRLPAITADMIGNGRRPDARIVQSVTDQLTNIPHSVSPSTFGERGARMIPPHHKIPAAPNGSTDIYAWFHIPWGEITLWSSIEGARKDIPVYPNELSDSRRANFTTMPDLLYQYEPWQIYESSGPRSNTYTFEFHRDMWTGDHRDGKANELIRFCEANCYPEYRGSAIQVPTVTLYISGKNLITGVLTDVTTNWDGPIGLDGWYLHCSLELSITEVSPEPLNYTSVKSKPLIG